MSAQLTHTINLNRNSLTARFYLWLYEANPSNINSCKLFWALVLAPILIVPVLTLKGLGKLVERWEANHPPKIKASKPPRVKSREEKLESFSGRASATYAKYQTVFRILGITLGVLLGLGILGGFVYLCIAFPLKVLVALAWIVGCIVLCVLGGLLIDYLSNGRGQGFVKLLVTLGRSFHQHTCAKIDLQ